MANEQSKQGILLEAGTNELEILVFQLGPTRYGVNVAKVREVIGDVKRVRVPKVHPAMVGVCKPRDHVMPLVDLQLYFEPGETSAATLRNVILMEFNDVQVAFLVDGVERIYRMKWSDMVPLPVDQGSAHSTVITSVCEIEGSLVLMVDFEKIAADIGGMSLADAQVGAADPRIDRGRQRVLLAEDSPTIRNSLRTGLTQAGYTSLWAMSDGLAAWQHLEQCLASDSGQLPTVVITDIEMPQMDGLHLCRRIKEHPQLKHIPVLVFSSLVSDDNLKKCLAVGAEAAITKPQLGQAVDVLDGLILRGTTDAAPPPPTPALEEALAAVEA